MSNIVALEFQVTFYEPKNKLSLPFIVMSCVDFCLGKDFYKQVGAEFKENFCQERLLSDNRIKKVSETDMFKSLIDGPRGAQCALVERDSACGECYVLYFY